MYLASYIRSLSREHGHPPGPRLPKMMRNTHSRNYYDLKGKGIDVHIFFFGGFSGRGNSIHMERAFTIFTNPSARAGYDTRSIFKRSLTGLNSEFSFS